MASFSGQGALNGLINPPKPTPPLTSQNQNLVKTGRSYFLPPAGGVSNVPANGGYNVPNTSTPSGPVYTPPPAPTVPNNQNVTSHTTTNADGSSVKQTYAPNTSTSSPTTPGMIPNAIPGSAASYANVNTNLEGQLSGLLPQSEIASEAAGLAPSVGNAAIGMSNYELGKITGAQNNITEQGVLNAQNENAALPGQKGLTSLLYNPLDPNASTNANNNLGAQSVRAGGVSSGTNLTEQLNTTQQNLSNFITQSKILNSLLPSGVNPTGSPLANQVDNWLKNNVWSTNQYNQYKAALAEIGSSYSQYLASKGGTPTGSEFTTQDVINGNITPEQLQQVSALIQQQGEGTISSYQSQIQQSQNQANTGNIGSSNNTSDWTWQ